MEGNKDILTKEQFESLLSCFSSIDEAAPASFTDRFTQDDLYEAGLIRTSLDGKTVSKKPSNITFELKRFFDIVFAIAKNIPLLIAKEKIFVAAFDLIRTTHKAMTIELESNEIFILIVFLSMKPDRSGIDEESLLKSALNYAGDNNRRDFNSTVFYTAIESLRKKHCIEINDGKVCLIEKIRLR